jgi:hypothetical protein
MLLKTPHAHRFIGILIWSLGLSAGAFGAHQETEIKGHETTPPGRDTPTPSDPYPLSAAGWGPMPGQGYFVSRWAEDWTGMRAAGHEVPLKAMPLGGDASLTLNTEARLRYDAYDNRQLKRGQDYQQTLFRGILGADLRFNQNVRVYGELGTAQVEGRRSTMPPNFQNDASLQQLFVDARGYLGSTLVGAMIGRQEFADGPRQLISLSNGPNLHRTWNGLRFYVHDQRYRVGGFTLRATKLGHDAFDETIDKGEKIQGLNASFLVSPEGAPNVHLDPFWIRSENPTFRYGGQVGPDDRHTFGLRFWGRQDSIRFDWTLAHQRGTFRDRDIDAWGLFAVQSYPITAEGWKPDLMLRLDIASGGGAYGDGKIRGFHQLYAAGNYIGEGHFLSLSNILIVSPGISLSPAPRLKLLMEYEYARRLQESDAVYAGNMRAYQGTESLEGQEIGGLFRVIHTWAVTDAFTLFLNYEHFAVGDILKRSNLPSSSYGQVGATYRY